MYPCEIKYKGIKYPSVEHYYVAQKFKGLQFYQGHYFQQPDFQELLSKVKDPRDVKKIGQSMKSRPDWDSVKLSVMEFGVNYKFSKDEKLKQMLLDTGDEDIKEGNWWCDNFWGDCTCDKCRTIVGENNLGVIIMKTRESLKPKREPSFEDVINKKFWNKDE
jgi:ribA/ribD-fused uncharacterized protein